jgi:hypothetical protein
MDGDRSADLAARRLDDLAEFFTSPVDSERGLAARLRYLTGSPAGYQAMSAAGIEATQRTLIAWLAEQRTPSRANLGRIETAYRALRRRNVSAHLTQRLNNGGRGTRVEIHPHSQAGVQPPRRRGNVSQHRSVNVRHWEGIVGAWADGDPRELAGEWQDAALEELGSDWGGYEYASGVGFSA